MTRLIEDMEKCFICGETNNYMSIRSTNEYGASDLDTRPPEMVRSTIHHWIRCCSSCGYCAPSLSDGPQISVQVIRSEAYVQQRNDPEYPELANRFLCSAMIQEAVDGFGQAGWDALHAAWSCDDAEARLAAEQCRKQAIIYFQQAQSKNLSFANEAGVEEAILADLLRRSRRFDEVEIVCGEGLAKASEDIIRKILDFQRQLALQKDAECYTVGDVE